MVLIQGGIGLIRMICPLVRARLNEPSNLSLLLLDGDGEDSLLELFFGKSDHSKGVYRAGFGEG